MNDELFPGFKRRRIRTSGAAINLVHGGGGPPLLLLHGYPQTHAIWHRIAPELAKRFSVVAADLRGYGDSEKPHGLPDHANYSKRAMAQDQVEAMRALGHETFFVVGHDRGGRVAHRMALDHPAAVEKLAVLDIVPTRTMYARVSREFAKAYYHWFFLLRPEPIPETLIGASPDFYLDSHMGTRHAGLKAFAPEALAEYRRCFRDPATIHASCEDRIDRPRARRGRHRPQGGRAAARSLGQTRNDRALLLPPRRLGRAGRNRPGTDPGLRPLHPGGSARGIAGGTRKISFLDC